MMLFIMDVAIPRRMSMISFHWSVFSSEISIIKKTANKIIFKMLQATFFK